MEEKSKRIKEVQKQRETHGSFTTILLKLLKFRQNIKLNVRFYIALSITDQSVLHLIPLPLEYCQLPYNVQGILIPLDGAQWTIFLATT